MTTYLATQTMFQFKQFTIHQENSAMKVTTDGCLFGAWVAERVSETRGKDLRILDIGAGTGLLSLMIAQKSVEARIDAIEMDGNSFEDCKRNFNSSPWSDRLTALHGDARDMAGDTTYDIIVCNPPFYGNEWSSPDPGRKLAHHGSGLRLEDLPIVVRKHLSPAGRFFFLLPYKRLKEISVLLDENALFIHTWLLARQTPAHDPFRILVEGSLVNPLLANFDELVIKDQNGNYTDAFRSLLANYYLKG